MKTKVAALSLSLGLISTAAFALTPEELIADLQAQGYTRVELRVGPSQIKAEAIRGTEKFEAVYLSSTGEVLKSASYMADSDESDATGVSVRERSSDFVRVASGDGAGSTDDGDSRKHSDKSSGKRHSDDDDDHGDDDRGSSGSDDRDDNDNDHGSSGSDDRDDDDSHDDDSHDDEGDDD